MTGRHIDGGSLSADLTLDVDVAVVGSGPAGASVARRLTAAGVSVAVLEAGPWATPEEMPAGSFSAMARYYRELGASVVMGRAPIPYVQGKMVGGSSTINGAICWRMPRNVYEEWVARDPALGDALPWARLEALTDEIEGALGVAPTDPRVAGPKNLLMAKGADALGLEHRPIRRNVVGCEGLGRCLQGCPKGNKQSMDRAFLPEAMRAGATIVSSVEVHALDLGPLRRRIKGVRGRSVGGRRVRVRARRGVVLAASAVQTPALLLRNRIRHGPVGRHFSCHPGVSAAGRFAEQVRMWEGATQGHEVIGLRREGLKFEALGFGLALLAARLGGVGSELRAHLEGMAHWVDWGAAVRSSAEGRVVLLGGRPSVLFTPSAADVRLFRRGVRVLGELMFAAGAEHVELGIRGWDPVAHDVADLERLEREGPTNAGAYTSAITHMFGTCRMGSDPRRSVVGLDFAHHRVDGLYVADSSVFPSNLGVNPQIPIMALATHCADGIVARG